jgi:hypothetical protein
VNEEDGLAWDFYEEHKEMTVEYCGSERGFPTCNLFTGVILMKNER